MPFEKGLLEGFVYDGVEQKLSGSQISPMVEFYSKMGESFVGLIDGRVIGVGGVYSLWEGAGSAWLFLNKEAREHKASVFKAILEIMNDLIYRYKINTLIVNCLDQSMESHRLISHLGFVKNREERMALYSKKIEV